MRRIGVEVNHVELVRPFAEQIALERVRGGGVVVLAAPDRPRDAGDEPCRGARVAAREQRDLVAEVDERVGEPRHDALRASVARRRDGFAEGRNQRDAHGGIPAAGRAHASGARPRRPSPAWACRGLHLRTERHAARTTFAAAAGRRGPRGVDARLSSGLTRASRAAPTPPTVGRRGPGRRCPPRCRCRRTRAARPRRRSSGGPSVRRGRVTVTWPPPSAEGGRLRSRHEWVLPRSRRSRYAARRAAAGTARRGGCRPSSGVPGAGAAGACAAGDRPCAGARAPRRGGSRVARGDAP